jgi:hypothetical protein
MLAVLLFLEKAPVSIFSLLNSADVEILSISSTAEKPHLNLRPVAVGINTVS